MLLLELSIKFFGILLDDLNGTLLGLLTKLVLVERSTH